MKMPLNSWNLLVKYDMTIINCPQGCGGTVDTAMHTRCPSCRRDLNSQQIQPEGSCWLWWGPPDHRMRCRKPANHKGCHSTHNDCGEMNPITGWKCGKDYDHNGPCWKYDSEY